MPWTSRRRLAAPAAPAPPAPEPPAARRRAGEEGFSLVEVLVALVVLMVVLLPVAGLLMQSTQVVGGSRARAVAAQLAASDIADLQSAAAAHPGVVPPDGLAGAPVAVHAPAGPTSWSSAAPVSTTVDGETYAQYVDGDWCVEQAAGGSSATWGTSAAGATVAPVFVVAVKVVWGPAIGASGSGASSGSSVVSFGAIAPQQGWDAATVAGASPADCPVGLS